METRIPVISGRHDEGSPMHFLNDPINPEDQHLRPLHLQNQGQRRLTYSQINTPIDSCGDPFAVIVGSGAPLQLVLDEVRAAAPTDCTVLLEGETGTGKELIVRAVHD